VVIPAPAAPPAAALGPAPATRAPAPVSGRPGGASSLVELSDATADGASKTWIKQQSQLCGKAGYTSLEPRCVHIQKIYVDQAEIPIQGEHKNCDNGTANRPESAGTVDGKTYIKAGTTVTIEYRCEAADKVNPDMKTEDGQSHAGTGRTGK
jgi:hypothetical protein